MNFQSLNYFIMLAREKNFTRAAEKLHLTQQTLSANVAALEKEWGMKFLIRHVPLELTDAGKVFYAYALQFTRGEEALSRTLKDIANEEAGNLTIGVGFVRERDLLPTLIAAFREKHPKVTFDLVEGSNEGLTKQLQEGDIDLAIAHFTEAPPGIDVKTIYQEEISFLVSRKLLKETTGMTKADIRELEDTRLSDMSRLAACPFITTNPHNIAGAVEALYLAAAPFTPQIVVRSDNMGTLIDLCLLGVGALFAPKNLLHHTLLDTRKADMVHIPLPETAYCISFGCRMKSPAWSIRDKFMDFTIESLRDVVGGAAAPE